MVKMQKSEKFASEHEICAGCGKIIDAEHAYERILPFVEDATASNRYYCEKCHNKEMEKQERREKTRKCFDLEEYFTWINVNVTKYGLIAVNPTTAEALTRNFPELGETYQERIFYAKQIVDLYNKKRREEV